MTISVKGKGNCCGLHFHGDNSVRDGHLILEPNGSRWTIALRHWDGPVISLTLSIKVHIEGFSESRTFFKNFTLNGRINLNFDDKVYIRFVISDFENQQEQLLKMSAVFEHYHELKSVIKVRPQVFSKDVLPKTPTNFASPQEPAKNVPSETPTNKLPTNDVPLKVSTLSPRKENTDLKETLSKDFNKLKEHDIEEITQLLNGEKVSPRYKSSNLSTDSSLTDKVLNVKNESPPNPLHVIQDSPRLLSSAKCRRPNSTGSALGSRSLFNGTRNDYEAKHQTFEAFQPKGTKDRTTDCKNLSNGFSSRDDIYVTPPSLQRKRLGSANINQPQTKKSKESEEVNEDTFDFHTKFAGDSADKENRPPGEIGLHNLGRTCYMNCSIQAVLSLDSLMNQLKNEINITKERGISRPLLRLFENRWDKCDAKKRAYLEDFWQMMVAITRMFSDPNVMEDSHEFLGKMFAVLDDEWGRSSNNIINHNIGLDVKTSYDCPCCHKSMDKMDRVNDLGLSFPEKNTYGSKLQLKQLLDEYFYRCIMDCSCSCLDKPREVSAFNQITRISPVVIIQLKRYFVKAGTACKNTTPVSIPMEIDLKKYYHNKSTSENTLNNNGNDAISTGDSKLIVREKIKSDSFNGGTDIKKDDRLLYTLRSVIEHSGNDTNKGHYITRTKWHNDWYECNDTTVSRVNFESIQEDDAYILFYVRDSTQS